MSERRVALVTGASRGIGRAIALDLAHRQIDVALIYRQDDAAAHAVVNEVQALGVHSRAFRADVDDFAQADSIIAEVVAHLGRLDVLVSNAGMMDNAPIWEMTETAWDRVVAVNLKGVFNYIRTAAPIFRAQRSGCIVTVGSLAGLRGRATSANYSAAKAGLIGLTKTVARDLGPYGVNVNCVAPGAIATDLAQSVPPDVLERFRAESVLGRLGQPEDVAAVVGFLCSPGARHITGEVIRVDGGQDI